MAAEETCPACGAVMCGCESVVVSRARETRTALRRLLDFVVSGRRYETKNPYTIPEVREAQTALGEKPR